MSLPFNGDGERCIANGLAARPVPASLRAQRVVLPGSVNISGDFAGCGGTLLPAKVPEVHDSGIEPGRQHGGDIALRVIGCHPGQSALAGS
jgi:hypothetical protein